MKIHILSYVLLVLILSIFSTESFIYVTEAIYEYVPRTENLNCLVFKTLKDPIEKIGKSLIKNNTGGVLSIFSLSRLYTLSLALCLCTMMFLVEFAALLGAVVLIVFYIAMYGIIAGICIYSVYLYNNISTRI